MHAKFSHSSTKLPYGDEHITVSSNAKYLGSYVSMKGDSMPATEYRVEQAKTAYNRLKPILHSTQLTIQQKLHLYQSVVLSTLLYGMEAHHINTSSMKKMESLQNRHLRAIVKRPAFLYHDTNPEIREMLKTSFIQALLLQKRLLLFKRMTDKPAEHIAAFTILWGAPALPIKQSNGTPWTKQLTKDITTFCKQRNAPPPSLDPASLVAWMCQCPKSHIKQYSSTHSTVDPKPKTYSQPQPLPALRCPMCSYMTCRKPQLTMHMLSVHKYRNIVASLIKEPQCPVCMKRFKNLKTAKSHYFRRCTYHVPEAIIQRLLLEEQQRPSAVAAPAQSTLHQYFVRQHPIA